MLQKHEARERRYKDQNWEEIMSRLVGRRSRKNSFKICTASLLYGVVGTQVGNYMTVSS